MQRAIPAPGFRPVAGKRAFEEITEQIRSQLARRFLRAGDRLPAERQLAEQFGVSRNTLREALRSLEIAGLLELKKGATGGAFITEGGGGAAVAGLADLYHMGAIRPQHLTEARILIGTEVARLACGRRTREDLSVLRHNVEAAEAATAAGDVEGRALINYEFHRLLARAAKNPVLIILTDALMEMTRHFVERVGYMPNRYVMPSRRRLLAYLREQDGEAAAAEMKGMLQRLQRFHLAAYEKKR
ncbi:MAG: FadR family transcriptional regulator [Betaproteobacteria bacterium]|nr:FadR family transcriptional regulator [Betaproteobacteria bacterium]